MRYSAVPRVSLFLLSIIAVVGIQAAPGNAQSAPAVRSPVQVEVMQPIYDDEGLFIIGHEPTPYCVADNAKPQG